MTREQTPDWKAKFPLLFRKTWNATGLANAIAAVDVDALCKEYRGLTECAPGRSESDNKYFVGHTGETSPRKRNKRKGYDEQRYAIALVNLEVDWPCANGGVFSLLDYQVPLKAWQEDGIGEIDLVGRTDQGRLMVIELKLKPDGDGLGNAPPMALMQGLRYAAIVETNHDAIATEAKCRFDVVIEKVPPVVQLLAPLDWWHGWQDLSHRIDGDWQQAFARLILDVESNLGVKIECRALGKAKPASGLDQDGRVPKLDRIPNLFSVRLDTNSSIHDLLPRPQG